MKEDEIRQLAGKNWHASLPVEVPIRINRAALEYEQVIILDQPFHTKWLACRVEPSTFSPEFPDRR